MEPHEIARLLPYVTWDTRHKLAQTCRALRSIICGALCEIEAFLYIAETYNCFIEVFETDDYGGNPYFDSRYNDNFTANSKLVGIKTWLGALLRTERSYHKATASFGLTLPVGAEIWSIREDQKLEQLVKKVKFLSGSFVLGCQSSQGDQYLQDVCRYQFPNGQRFDIENFLKLSDKELFLELSSAAHARADCWWDDVLMDWIAEPHVETAVRLVYIDRPGELTTIERCYVPSVSGYRNVARQLFVTRAVLRQEQLIKSYVTAPKSSPYVFTRWLTGVKTDPSIEPALATTDASDYLLENLDLLEVDPASFWEQSTQEEGTTSTMRDQDDHNQTESFDSESDHSSFVDETGDFQRIRSAYRKHWRHAMSQIEEHLGRVFKLFTKDEVENLTAAYEARNLTLTQVGKSESSIGAYLEVTLNNCDCGPNPKLQENDHAPEICVLYIGPADAVLYIYHERHC